MGTKIHNALKNILVEVGASAELIKCFDINDKIYHYTTLSSFIGIVSNFNGSNGLWLSNAEFLNDNDEISHGKTLVLKYLENLSLNQSIDSQIIDNAKANIDKNDYSFYVGCFSKSCNLDQFRHYADNAEGVCIEFDLKSNDNYFEQLMINNPNNPPFIFPVIYDDNLKKEFVDIIYKVILLSKRTDKKKVNNTIELPTGKIIGMYGLYSALTMSVPILGAIVGLGGFIYDSVKTEKEAGKNKEIEKIDAIKNGIKELGKSLEIDRSITELEAFSKIISIYLPILKNKDFKPEDEIRLVFYGRDELFLKSKLKYRAAKNSKIIPYFSTEQLLNKECNTNLPITKVIIGSKSRNDYTAKSIKLFLDNNGYSNVDVVFSDSPYRP